ncbi:hypothetical protein OOU_Y34scaffold00500g17 [Pyricularia oryzae Y34]|uniref:Uncharacterized protein n=2 Tax=Pyricularia oryzae TaxID=318829 RepID=A0AA97P010_PYRO3|nr:hypothetical protein OOU_Y34scaffold00500g17 [Pyricularia oryzae Y34]
MFSSAYTWHQFLFLAYNFQVLGLTRSRHVPQPKNKAVNQRSTTE